MHTKRINVFRSAKTLALTMILFSVAAGIAKPQTRHQGSEEARIERVLSGLRAPIAIKGQPPERSTLAEEMAQSHLPGISIPVIDNDQIVQAIPFVFQEARKTNPATPSPPFQ